MSFAFRSFIAGMAALGAACGAWAATPAPGEYEAQHGAGTLSIRADESGALSFKIFSLGVNGHTCELDGPVRDGKGYTGQDDAGAQESGPPCVIAFEALPAGYSVTTETESACHTFCGARAWFENDYVTPPAGCKPKEREARRAAFTSQYRARDYRRALEALDPFYRQCGEFLHWIDLDAVRNDLAVTQLHLGNKDACLAILKDTLAASAPRETDLNLPPGDFEAYLPVAKATWHNLKLCGSGAKKARTR